MCKIFAETYTHILTIYIYISLIFVRTYTVYCSVRLGLYVNLVEFCKLIKKTPQKLSLYI